jgi:hypothetical protein
MYTRIQGGAVEIETPEIWNMIGCSMTALPLVLSPNIILPQI